jgi:hypothetical protein
MSEDEILGCAGWQSPESEFQFPCFMFFALSLRNFTVFYRTVLMYVHMTLLKNTKSRSN